MASPDEKMISMCEIFESMHQNYQSIHQLIAKDYNKFMALLESGKFDQEIMSKRDIFDQCDYIVKQLEKLHQNDSSKGSWNTDEWSRNKNLMTVIFLDECHDNGILPVEVNAVFKFFERIHPTIEIMVTVSGQSGWESHTMYKFTVQPDSIEKITQIYQLQILYKLFY